MSGDIEKTENLLTDQPQFAADRKEEGAVDRDQVCCALHKARILRCTRREWIMTLTGSTLAGRPHIRVLR